MSLSISVARVVLPERHGCSQTTELGPTVVPYWHTVNRALITPSGQYTRQTDHALASAEAAVQTQFSLYNVHYNKFTVVYIYPSSH